MKIKQYRPAFFDGFEDIVVEVTTQEELLAIPFVNKFTLGEGEFFYKFSLSNNFLIAEYHRGKNWLVVATIDDTSSLNLPKWESK